MLIGRGGKGNENSENMVQTRVVGMGEEEVRKKREDEDWAQLDVEMKVCDDAMKSAFGFQKMALHVSHASFIHFLTRH